MEVRSKTIAVLITCHNRKDHTLDCIGRLVAQRHSNELDFKIFLVDDGSRDGTSFAVQRRYPSVHILHGDGSLYWAGGMRMAMAAAMRENFDFLLWLNDDTKLDPDAVECLLQTYSELEAKCQSPPIIVGSIRDPVTGELSYGGSVHASRWHPLRFSQIMPASEPQKCDVFNGNCVLLPRRAVDLVGDLHPKLVHAGADYAYGLRASRRGVSSWISPGYFGECPKNSLRGTWMDLTLPLWQRYKRLFDVKGQPPMSRLIYYFEYGGPLWWLLYPLVYFRPLVGAVRKMLSRQ